MKSAIAALLLALCPSALAEPVFFDDFEGDALLPHWGLPDPWDWEYNVSNSMLNVTGLFYPSDPHFGGNIAAISAGFAAQTDFRMDVWMGWDAGQAPHRLWLMVLGGSGTSIIANFGYRNEAGDGPGAVIFAGASGSGITQPAPPPGMYQFTIVRADDEFQFFFNGEHLVTHTDNFGTPATGVAFDFLGPYPEPLGAFHIDRVLVIPGPGALLLFALPLFRRSRR